jgi:NAD-dependent dihydropyrimidine dehydrogenase PreA subunit
LITIDATQCTGCGACMEICPSGAIYMVEGKAMVDRELCNECEACLTVCPVEAITIRTAAQPMPEPARTPALRPEPEVIRIATRQEPAPLRSRVLPVVGTALVWAGREVLPRLADLLLDALDRRAARPQTYGASPRRESLPSGNQGRGRQHRHRRRGGG